MIKDLCLPYSEPVKKGYYKLQYIVHADGKHTPELQDASLVKCNEQVVQQVAPPIKFIYDNFFFGACCGIVFVSIILAIESIFNKTKKQRGKK